MKIHELNTARLQLRAWSEDDLPAFAALNADEAVMAHYPATLNRTQSDAYAKIFMERMQENGWGFWALSHKHNQDDTSDSPFLGFVGLNKPNIELPFGPCVEIGWRLARHAWGQGYATEAAQACLTFAFRHLGLDEVVSFTALSNQRSEAVMRRLGMTKSPETFMHPALPKQSHLREHVLYKLSASDWCKTHKITEPA